MRVTLALILAMLAIHAAAQTTRQAPQRVSATTRPHLVPDASQHTIIGNLEEAVIRLSEAADTAGARGDRVAFERLTDRKREYVRMIDGLRNQPLPPSLYPIEVGKRGCLYGVTESETVIRAGEERLVIPLYVITWFRVKAIEKRRDGSMLAEVYDRGTLLYRVVLEGTEQVVVGTTGVLANVQFECVSAEGDDAGTIYHLQRQ